MANVFLANTELYVTVPNSDITLSQLCQTFGVDVTSAHIKPANSRSVVATLPTDSLPEFSGDIDYVLYGVSSSNQNQASSIADGAGKKSTTATSNQNQNNGNNENREEDEEEDMQRVVLRVAQLFDSISGSNNAVTNSNSKEPLMTVEEEEEFQKFLRTCPSGEQKNNNTENLEKAKSAALMFVSSTGCYHPLGISQLVKSMSSNSNKKQDKTTTTDTKYSFENF